MAEQADPGWDLLAEIQLPTPLYRATREVGPDAAPLRDGEDHVYQAGLRWPTLRRTLSQDFYGLAGAADVTLELAAGTSAEPDTFDTPPAPHPDAAAFRAVEARGATVILRLLDRATGTLTHRFTGTIQQVTFTPDGRIQLTVADTLPDVFATPYPRVRITPEAWPTATSEALALGATVPIHHGQHREHTPCRHVEATERAYAHGTTSPRLFTQHRYVVGAGLARAVQGDPNVLPTVRALYRGMPIGAALIPPGEYAVAVNRTLTAPTALTATLAAGGSLTAGAGPTPARVYQVTALHASGESLGSNLAILTITAANVAANFRSVRLDWVPVEGATGYAVSVNVQGLGMLLSIVAGGDAAAFIDTGDYQGLAPYAPPIVDTTGQGTVEVVFRQAQLGVDSALAPILADVAMTRRAWDGASCRSVWHLDHDTRDERPARQNPLVRATTTSLWRFERTMQDAVGPNHCVMTNVRPDDFVPGPHQKPVWLANGVGYGVAPTATGLDPDAATSVQIECELRTDADTLERLLIVCEKWGSAAAYSFRVAYGKIYGLLWDGTLTAGANPQPVLREVAGSLRLDGARHRLRWVVNRATARFEAYVDDVLEDSTSIAGLGSLANTGPFVIGTSSFTPGLADAMLYGELGWLRWDTDPAPFLPAGEGFDGTHADQRVLLVPHAAARDLDPGTATGWTLEARIRIPALAANATSYGLAGKRDPVTGLGLLLGIAGQSALPGSPWVVRASLGYTGASALATGGSLGVGEHDVALTYQAPTPTTEGLLTVVANGAVVGTTVLPAGAVPTVQSTTPFTLGGTGDPLRGPAPMTIREVRVTARARTLAELAEAHYLAERNPVRQVRSLLVSAAHGPGLVLDTASWDAAEAALAAVAGGQLQTDTAFVEPRPLGEHLAELLRVRGIRLAMTPAGLLGCTVDQPQAVRAAFGRRDGYWRNLAARPTWTQTPLAAAFRQCRVRYRRKRSTDGQVDRFVLRTSPRDVHPVGRTEPELLDCPALREPVAADLVAGYLARRLALQDVTVTFPTRDETALAVVPGDRVQLSDPLSGRPDTVLEVRATEESGTVRDGARVQMTCAPITDDVYTYVPGTLPLAPDPETRPDYSATPPGRLADFAVTFAATIANDGRRVWTATATWSPPTTLENLQYLLLDWRPSGTTAWQSAPQSLTRATAILTDAFDDGTSYQFRLTGVNRFGLVGAPSVVTAATTTPGAPATPTGLKALAAGAARQRRWDWANSPERNVRKGGHYNVEVYASATAVLANRVATAEVRQSSYTYTANPAVATEVNLPATTQRWLRVQAVNASGDVSLWSALVAATGTAVGTDDVDPGAVTQIVAFDISAASLASSTNYQTIGNTGAITIPAGGAQVEISVDFDVTYPSATVLVLARLQRLGADIVTPGKLFRTLGGGNHTAGYSEGRHLKWAETAAAGSVGPYVVQVRYLVLSGGGTLSVEASGVVTMHKR